MKTVLSSIILSVGSILYAQNIEIIKVDIDNDITPNDLIYALPVTKLQCSIKGKETVYKLGLKKIAANKVFTTNGFKKLNEQITSEKKSFVANEILMNTKTIPDENHIYNIKLKKRWNKTNKVTLQIAENGLISGGAFVSEDHTFKIISSTVSNILGLFVKNNDPKKKLYDSQKDPKTLFKKIKISDIKNSEIDNVNQFGITKSLKTILKKRNKLNDTLKSFQDKLGQIEKEFVFENKYFNNIKVLKHKTATLRILIKEIKLQLAKEQEKFAKILNSFMGTKEINDIILINEFNYQFNHKGFTAKSDYFKIQDDGNKAYKIVKTDKTVYNAKENNKLKCTSCFKIDLTSGIDDFGDKFYAKLKAEPTNKGLAYKIPASYKIAVSTHKAKQPTQFNFYAVGNVYGRLSNRTNLNSLVFYPNLGWFKEIGAESKGISTEDIDAIGGALKDTTGVFKKKSEFDKLKEETDLLELQLKKKTLEKDLEGSVVEETEENEEE